MAGVKLYEVAFMRTLIHNRIVGMFLLVGFMLVTLVGCTKPPPQKANDICNVFTQYPAWYWYTKRTEQRWGMPIAVQMAIMYQESSFNGASRPPREKILWVIPWKHVSTAYGYSQALDPTWDNYIKSTGNFSGSRNDFGDASDFVGWYGQIAHQKLSISMSNAYAQYLAYHEGVGGYARGSYNSKPWLIQVAHQVQTRANVFNSELQSCQNNFSKPFWMYLTTV